MSEIELNIASLRMQIASTWHRLKALPGVAKAGIVVGGYIAAILLAVCVVWIYIELTSGPDRDLSSGMHAFGDMLLFIAVFGLVSIVPTGLALAFMRGRRIFWRVLSLLALVVVSTGIASVPAVLWVPHEVSLGASLDAWAALSGPRIFVSPFLAASFGLATLLAPRGRIRWSMLGATGAEAMVSLFGFVYWAALIFVR
jgi:hypothetical protein